MNDPSPYQLRQGVLLVRRLARRLTHARQKGEVPQGQLAPLEELALRAQKNLDEFLEKAYHRSARPLRNVKEVRRCFRQKLPLPGEPLHWHLTTTMYDVCPSCRRPTIEKEGRRHRVCSACGSEYHLPQGVGIWKEQKLHQMKPNRLREDDPLPCIYEGCDWDRYRGEWCDYHGNQVRFGQELTPHPHPRKECAHTGCPRSCIPQSDYCGIHQKEED